KLHRFRSKRFRLCGPCGEVLRQGPTAFEYHHLLLINDSLSTSLLERRNCIRKKTAAGCRGLHGLNLRNSRHPRLIFAFYSLRNPNYKPRAILRRTDVDTSIMAFDNPLDDRKPEAASLTACGKHWIEDTSELLFVNSRSRISDLDNNVAFCDAPRKAYLPIRGGLA